MLYNARLHTVLFIRDTARGIELFLQDFFSQCISNSFFRRDNQRGWRERERERKLTQQVLRMADNSITDGTCLSRVLGRSRN